MCVLCFPQFSCDTQKLVDCVAEQFNWSSSEMVTPCVIHNLSHSAADGLDICPSNTPSCPFPEVKRVYNHTKIEKPTHYRFHVDFRLYSSILMFPWRSVSVFQLQRAADPASLLSVPADQQYREAGFNAAHPAHFSAACGVARSGAVWQRRPLRYCQCPVSTAASH